MTTYEVVQDCVIYARYSSHNQRDVSIEQQVEECEEYARRKGWRVVKVYADRHLSGTTDQRPQFQQMLKDSERGRWSIVLTYKVDRFARNRYDSATYKYRLKRNGVRVEYAKEAIPEGPEGILLEAVLEGSAEYYSENLAQNVRRGLQYNAEACLSNGRIPYGYCKGPDGHFEIREPEAALVREMFSRFAVGDPFARIVRDLNERGVPTKRGGPWRSCTVRGILSNEAYRGVYHFGDVRVEGGVPRLVDDDTWTEVNRRLDAVKGTRVKSPDYLLTGKAKCGLCGGPLIGTVGNGRNGAKYYYYQCKEHRVDKSYCPKRPIPRWLLEERVVNCIVDAMNDDGIVSWIVDSAMELQRREAEENRAAPDALRSELADVKKAIKGILKAIEAGVVTASTKDRLLELEAEQERLEDAIADASLPAPTVSREAITYWLTRFRGESEGGEEAMRDMAAAMVWEVRVWDDHAEAVLNYSGTEEIVSVPLVDALCGGSPDGCEGGESPSESRTSCRNTPRGRLPTPTAAH